MRPDEIHLTLPAAPKPKHARIALDGAEVRRETWTGTGEPRHSGRTHRDERRAAGAFDDEVRRRMAEGHVVLGDRASAASGEVVLACSAPGMCRDVTFDLSPDGRTVAIGTWLPDAGAWIHVTDVDTGVRRLVHTEAPGPHVPTVDTVLFEAGGEGLVYTVNEETRRLDLRTGGSTLLATCASRPEYPYVPQPAFDAARERLLVVDGDRRACVLGADGTVLSEVDAAELRTGALSPSGRLLALAFPGGAAEVRDADTGEPLAAVTFPFELHRIGFHPGERLLIAGGPDIAGPVAVAIDTGETVWGGRPGKRRGWEFTPGGALLAAGEYHGQGTVRFRDAATFAEVPRPAPVTTFGPPHRVLFSADGTLMAVGAYRDRVTVYAV